MVARSYNHPSVILYSTGNEVAYDVSGKELARGWQHPCTMDPVIPYDHADFF